MPYDPVTGDWYDDELDAVSSLYGGATNRFMPGLGIGPLFPGDYNKYGEMEPYEQADVNQQFSGLKSLLQVLKDPYFNQMVSTETGADVFPYEQLAMPGNPFMGGMDLPMGGMGGGGGGGYGGGGYGGGAVQPFITPNIEWARGSNDPVMQTIVQQMDRNVDPFTVKQMLAASPETDQNQLDVYNEAIDTLYDEKGKAMIAGAQMGGAGGMPQLQPNALQQQVAKWGGMNPLAQYGPGNMPSDIDVNQYLQQAPDTTGMDRRLREAERGALYREEPSPQAGVNQQIEDLVARSSGSPMASAVPTTSLTRALSKRRGQRGTIELTNPAPALSPREEEVRANALRTYGLGGAIAPEDRGITASVNPEMLAMNRTTGTTAAPPRWTRPGLIGGMTGGLFVRQPGEDEETFETERRGPGGRKMVTNRAGDLAQRLRAQRAGRPARTEAINQGIQQMIAADLAQRGRTPQRDALRAQMGYLRQMGIGV